MQNLINAGHQMSAAEMAGVAQSKVCFLAKAHFMLYANLQAYVTGLMLCQLIEAHNARLWSLTYCQN